MAEEFDRTSGRVVNVPEQSGDVSDQQGEGGQPKQKEDARALSNLDEDPNFRKFKGKMDKRLNSQVQENAQLRRQVEEMQNSMNEARMSSMDETQQAVFRAELAEANALRIQQEAAERLEAQEREMRLRGIASRGKLPEEVLLEAEDPFQALERLVDHFVGQGMSGGQAVQAAQQVQGQQAQQEYAPPPNNVDIGSGAPPEVASALQQRYEQAFESMDSSAVLDIMAEADSKGVRLNERNWTR